MNAMRSALIALSANATLQDAIVRIPISRRVARRFVAGETLEDAIGAIRALNDRGVAASLDHLGENVTTESEAIAAANEYLVILDALERDGLKCNVSLKLTQMGLDIDEDFCFANVSRIIRRAAEFANFVRIDMEGSSLTGRTISLYRRLRQDHENVGIVIQAYLHRSQADVESLIAAGCGNFRLCKGAYNEPETIAFQARADVTRALNGLVATCLSDLSPASRTYCGIASHDEDVINFARAFAYQHDIPPSAYEFQMLYGVRRELQAELVRRGYQMRVYVPYGTHWYPYLMRRLAERPANLLFFIRALSGD